MVKNGNKEKWIEKETGFNPDSERKISSYQPEITFYDHSSSSSSSPPSFGTT